jgi:hypothetical protein
MADTITLNNVGSSAWEVTSVNGTYISADTTVENPVISLSNIGTRYIFYNDGYSAHPLEFLDSNGDVLLSQSGTGTFESDPDVNWVDNDTSVEFTLTTELSDQITDYRCTIHTSAMAGSIDSPQTVDYTPSTGSVSITSPSANATVTNPVSVSMQATNFTIEPASNGLQDGAGHFHLLIDQPAVTPGEVIPNNPDNGYYHYGDGSTSAELDLTVGTHTIRLQAGDANHRAYDLTDSVSITVEVDYTPATGSVSFTTPTDGSTVLDPVLFEMQATDFTIEAASNGVQDGAGHFHILVDQPAVTPGEVIPNNPDNGYYHYGDGSTSAEISLTTGSHTVRLQAGDANHKAYDLTDKIDITVEEQTSGGTVVRNTDPLAVTTDIGHVNSIQISAEVTNRGATQTTKTVELVTGSTTVDSQSVSLNVGETTTLTLSDGTFGEPDIGSTRQYTVTTGGREPAVAANIIGVIVVTAGEQQEIPTFDASEIRIEQTGELHFDQTDELKLTR